MKKNKMMRLASVMLVATLMTTSMISGTFAKYVTEGSGQDTARVAKWGVEVSATGETFAKTYEKTDTTFTLDTNTVVSTTDKVVAPGTKGDMASFAITGTPEVAVRVTANANLDLNNGWMVDGAFYCPIQIKVGATPINGLEYSNKADFETAVENEIAKYTVDYKAGTDLSGIAAAEKLAISWEWPYETGDSADQDMTTLAGNDVKDTALGDQAAEGQFGIIDLTVTTTVTQID